MLYREDSKVNLGASWGSRETVRKQSFKPIVLKFLERPTSLWGSPLIQSLRPPFHGHSRHRLCLRVYQLSNTSACQYYIEAKSHRAQYNKASLRGSCPGAMIVGKTSNMSVLPVFQASLRRIAHASRGSGGDKSISSSGSVGPG